MQTTLTVPQGKNAETPTAQTALATAMHLAAMSPDELAAASRMLHDAEARYDRMSGICATMNGIVLLEAKRRLPHGSFQSWVESHFSNVIHGSHLKGGYRAAVFRMRIAEAFLASLSGGKSKLDPRIQFEATQLLFADFTAQLAADQAAPVDVENPVVSAVAAFVDGRSFSALRDALPAREQGGNRHPKCPNCHGDLASKRQAVCPHCRKPTGETPPTPDEEMVTLKGQLRTWGNGLLQDSFLRHRTWRCLDKHEAVGLAAHFATVAKDIEKFFDQPAARRAEMTLHELLGDGTDSASHQSPVTSH